MIVIKKLNKKAKPPTPEVKIVLLGLTPGKQQHIAINASTNARSGAFKGYMRKQIYEWFKELGLSKFLQLENEDSLFQEERFTTSLFTTSLLREPVYCIKDGEEKNYTGRNPFPWKNEDLYTLMKKTLNTLETLPPGTLIVPMGQIVSKAIQKYSDLDQKHFILHGFPHPSGANGHRGRQFEENKRNLKKITKKFLSQTSPF
ncbi:MAG: hypothetical protein CME64_08920 [Halobacteriovoraceae bacterium]|nr:hypothetical protein [Halobacteriovoraceae bacterium]|tara:strand:+ start:319001 stop:319606 length:606 start_codon:yes stop_codon:yes gene_type:complete